jgi:CRISPR-associated protein Csx14
MPELRFTIDPCNPGQFYACCGLFELLDIAGIDTQAQFYLDGRQPRKAEFVVRGDGDLSLDWIARAIKEAKFTPAGVDQPPFKDSITPVSVSIFGLHLALDWWLNEFHDSSTQLKCWAGQVTTSKLTSELPKLLPMSAVSFGADAFTSTRFGVDPRSAWVALDLGYSPNQQGQDSRTYPMVELLAAFGLQGFRPYGNRSQGFTYALWLEPLPCTVARTAAVQPWDGLPAALFQFQLGGRGSYKFFSFAERKLM